MAESTPHLRLKFETIGEADLELQKEQYLL